MRTPIVVLVSALMLVGGCGSLWQDRREESREPFEPSAGAENSDLVFLRTGDRSYYYIIDKRRGQCFFHARLYGKDHMVTIDCQKLPEYSQYAPAAPQPTEHARRGPTARAPRYEQGHGQGQGQGHGQGQQAPPPHGYDQPPGAEQPGEARSPRQGPETRVAPSPAPPPDPSANLSNEDREAFRRAYVQHFCSRRSGAAEPLEVILSRHGLDQERWDYAKAEFSADRELWEALTAEALDACP